MLPIWVFCMCKSRGRVELRLFFILSFHVSFRSACRIVRHIYAWSTQKVHWSWEATSRKRTSFIFSFLQVPCQDKHTQLSYIFLPCILFTTWNPSSSNFKTSRFPLHFSFLVQLLHAKLYTNFNLLNNNGMD